MALSDIGKIEFEDTLAKALNTDKYGARITDIPKVIEDLGITDVLITKHTKNVTFGILERALKDSSRKAVVGIYDETLKGHAVLVDKIENGRVFVRDPLPLNQGSYYSIAAEDFKSVFNKTMITIKAN